MGWADEHIKKLSSGLTISFKPRGNSMLPYIKSGQEVKVRPVTVTLTHYGSGDWKEEIEAPEVGDIVLCKVKGTQYLHRVTAIKGERFQISNAKGRVNGWIGISQIFGIKV
jgi:hypothetical protein